MSENLEEKLEAWAADAVDQMVDDGVEQGFHEGDAAVVPFQVLIKVLGPCALPSILGMLVEYGMYSDEEFAILREAQAKVIASDEIYQDVEGLVPKSRPLQ
jgi:hypothetical protein